MNFKGNVHLLLELYIVGTSVNYRCMCSSCITAEHHKEDGNVCVQGDFAHDQFVLEW